MSSQIEYPNAGIASLNSLAKVLKLKPQELLDLSEKSSNFYRIAKCIDKADGTQRVTYDALPPLKEVLSTLRKRVVDKAILPAHIAAGKKGTSYIDNAKVHAGCKGLLSEDIKNFFPSISYQAVCDAFKFLYKMPKEIAEIVSLLCTKDGYLVQGSPVSGALANIIFYDKEPSLVDNLKVMGFRYTRYYDDVHISHESLDFSDRIGELRSKIYGVFLSKGLHPHRSNQKSNYTNQSGRMSVHGIITNNSRIKPNPKKISETRAMLFQMERLLETDYSVESIISYFRSINGKIQTVKAQGSHKSKEYLRSLHLLMRKVDESKAKKYARKARKVKNQREYNQLSSKLSILKKINVRVMKVVKIESDFARHRLAKKNMNSKVD